MKKFTVKDFVDYFQDKLHIVVSTHCGCSHLVQNPVANCLCCPVDKVTVCAGDLILYCGVQK